LLLQVTQELWLHRPFEAFLAAFAANQIQKEYADGRSRGRRKHVQRKPLVIPCDQNHREQIATDRKEEEGIIRNRKEHEPEPAQVQKNR
jgi:hypothetical protein